MTDRQTDEDTDKIQSSGQPLRKTFNYSIFIYLLSESYTRYIGLQQQLLLLLLLLILNYENTNYY